MYNPLGLNKPSAMFTDICVHFRFYNLQALSGPMCEVRQRYRLNRKWTRLDHDKFCHGAQVCRVSHYRQVDAGELQSSHEEGTHKSTPRKHGRCYLRYCCRSNGCRKTCAIFPLCRLFVDVAGLSPACTRLNMASSSASMPVSDWLPVQAISSVLCHLGKSNRGQKPRLLSRSLTLVPSSRFCAEDNRYMPPKIRGRSKVKTALFCPSFDMTFIVWGKPWARVALEPRFH